MILFVVQDVLVLDSILELFCADYGYGLTINANEFDPVDIGVQFVQYTHYNEAIAWLKVRTPQPAATLPHSRHTFEIRMHSYSCGLVNLPESCSMNHHDLALLSPNHRSGNSLSLYNSKLCASLSCIFSALIVF